MPYESDPYRVSFKDYYEHKARCDQEIRHIRKQDAQDQKHHDEMMALLEKFKQLKQGYVHNRNAYDRLGAQWDVLVDIVKEHLPEMSITEEEIKARLDEAYESAKLTYPK